MRISDWSSDVCSSDLVGKALTLNGEITQQYGNGATPSGFGGTRFAFFHRRIEFRVGSKLPLVHDLPREHWRLEHLHFRIARGGFGIDRGHDLFDLDYLARKSTRLNSRQ